MKNFDFLGVKNAEKLSVKIHFQYENDLFWPYTRYSVLVMIQIIKNI